ncbi:MAG: beta-ketoacyl synthase N-terminal-like domain-containing protein [Eudoraea sp.]|uniref:beta-ketoacyl synthase N-terminal-like domain-containing protein n=1 Tax=Eudoraea sp. TaxID=1979955 RepID=UPI003C793ECE
MSNPITISSISSISALGFNDDEIWSNYCKDNHVLSELALAGKSIMVSKLSEELELKVSELKENNYKYRNLDRTVLLGILVARKAMEKAKWDVSSSLGINVGSSRGATELFERYYIKFLENNRAEVLTSPTTTLGNISSWIAHDLNSKGLTISHSITCSTALHALLNGVAWLRSGMAKKFIIGGVEAPLTPFTIEQMHALKIYSSKGHLNYPCRSMDLEKTDNTMVLGEAAGVACLQKGITKNSLAIIEGVGYATEQLVHGTSLSANAHCIQESMRMALENIDKSKVDCIVMHAPGTIKGDMAEYKAIKAVFGEAPPAVTSNKWQVGHTFGASGILSLEMAVMMIQRQKFCKIPYLKYDSEPKVIKRVLINAVGFGGNAVSVLLKAI